MDPSARTALMQMPMHVTTSHDKRQHAVENGNRDIYTLAIYLYSMNTDSYTGHAHNIVCYTQVIATLMYYMYI